MPPSAHFASLRSELVVVEKTSQPIFSNGKQIGQERGLYHRFSEHRCTVTGAPSIAFMRGRAQAMDSPGIWELDASDVPQVTDLLAEMATADVDRVREILQIEEAGPKRMVVLETCRAVLQRAGASERRPGEKATVTA
jgi:hypothetical protein